MRRVEDELDVGRVGEVDEALDLVGGVRRPALRATTR